MKLRFIFILSFLLLSCKPDKKAVKTIKLAHSLGVTHPVHETMVYMADLVKEKSNGKLQIQIYSNSQLGSEKQCLELLQIGSLGMTKVSAAVMENFSPDLKVLGYPYLFRSDAHRFKVYDGPIGKELLSASKKYWLKGLTYFDAGNRSFYTKNTPINTPEDLKGLKIRVMQSPTAIEMVKRFGGAPTPISWGELYTSLQQGVVDGAENNLPSFYSSKHYEVCKYFSLNEHTSVPDILVIGTPTWEKLAPNEKDWLLQAVAEATQYQRKLWKEAEEKAMEEIQKAGVKILRPDKSLFEARSKDMLQHLKQTDGHLYDLAQQIKSVQ
ncbi:TRAP transporter substrate-binding protein [Flagellimonas pelagia]|uniref:TRAP transporter substrate-binding protein n=1 Tax=Flagellimonas pelagia TaxID=2306998 RepID=A0A3A1NR50_9FLAO|nr:TRAP transporter substrate-binding protein [Allomuricauda maritima]RIV46414.1 TRAP transporter substrate-binding protein [Allomuricauda maritima]TXJ99075.1 TRAP transporter substrate-binding protein [Allomuricauda maritima]